MKNFESTKAIHCFLAPATVFAGLAACVASAAQVGTFEWTGAVSNDWSVPGNWTLVDGIDVDSDGLPNRNGDDSELVVFHAAGAQNLNTVLGVSRSIGALHFNSNASTTVTIGGLHGDGVVDPDTSVRLLIEGSRGRGDVMGEYLDDGYFLPNDFYPVDILVPAGQHHKIVGSAHVQGSGFQDLMLDGKQVWQIDAGGSLEIAARIRQVNSNTALYEKTGDGLLILSSHQSGSFAWQFGSGARPGQARYAFQIKGGTVQFAGTTAVPRGHTSNSWMVHSGATLEFHRPGGVQNYGVNNGALTLNGDGFNGQGALHNSGGDNIILAGTDDRGHFILESDSTIRVSAGSLTTYQGIEGSGGLTKTGAGILYLALNDGFHASHAYTGNTTVAEGTLALLGDASITHSPVLQVDASATLDVSAKTGGLTLGTTVAQTLKGDGGVVGDVGFIAGSMLGVDYGGATIDSLSISGIFDITNATVDFNSVGSQLTAGAHVFTTYGSLVGGAFTSVVDIPGGFSIDYNYLGGNQIALVGEPIALVPGDFDGDGDVDGADFVAWQTNFPAATGATLADGDADGDGDVDGADFVVWQTNFPFTPASGVATVPEPSSGCLLLLGAVWAGAGARRRLKSVDEPRGVIR